MWLRTIALLTALCASLAGTTGFAQSKPWIAIDDCETEAFNQGRYDLHILIGYGYVFDNTLCSALAENGFTVTHIKTGWPQNSVRLSHTSGQRLEIVTESGDNGADDPVFILARLRSITNPDTKRRIYYGSMINPREDGIWHRDIFTESRFDNSNRGAIFALLGKAPFDFDAIGFVFDNGFDGPTYTQARSAVLDALRSRHSEFAGRGDLIYDYAANGFPDGTTGIALNSFGVSDCEELIADELAFSCQISLHVTRSWTRNRANQNFIDFVGQFAGNPIGSLSNQTDVFDYQEGKAWFVQGKTGQWVVLIDDVLVERLRFDEAPRRDKTITIRQPDDPCEFAPAAKLSDTISFMMGC